MSEVNVISIQLIDVRGQFCLNNNLLIHYITILEQLSESMFLYIK